MNKISVFFIATSLFLQAQADPKDTPVRLNNINRNQNQAGPYISQDAYECLAKKIGNNSAQQPTNEEFEKALKDCKINTKPQPYGPTHNEEESPKREDSPSKKPSPETK